MRYTVRNPPITVIAPRLAADIVTMVREGAGVRLDYTPDGLAVADRLIGAIRREQPPQGAVNRALLGFGAYAGEVLVRNADAWWVPFDDAKRTLYGQPFGICMPDGQLWNPLGEALEQYGRGVDVSLLGLYHLAVGSVAGRARV